MPCLKDITLAFNRFASSFKLEHSSLFSSVPSTLTPSIVGAISFSIIMAIVTVQFLRSRAWFLWTLAVAAMLQCAGFIASAVHSQDGTNHLAFLASFATITFAPLLLSVSVFLTFNQLSQTVIPAHLKSSGGSWTFFSQRLATFVFVPCLIPLAFFTFGIYHISRFLSPAPIDGRDAAFSRLLEYELGVRQFQTAHCAEAAICAIFTVFSSIFTCKSKNWKVDALNVRNPNWRELLHTINFVNCIIFVRACFKAYESQAIAASKASLGDNGSLFWFCDVFPMLTALVLFCAVKPTAYLPDQVPSIVLDPEALYMDEKRGYDDDTRRI